MRAELDAGHAVIALGNALLNFDEFGRELKAETLGHAPEVLIQRSAAERVSSMLAPVEEVSFSRHGMGGRAPCRGLAN